MHTFISGPARLPLVLKNLACCGWGGLERCKEFQFPSPNGKLVRKSLLSDIITY